MPVKKPPIRVLIADDHPIVRDGLRRLLEVEREFTVVAEADNGVDTLALTLKHKPDILILDVRMPGRSGIEVLQDLKNANLKTQVIILTASIEDREIFQGMQLGARGIVLKESPPELILKSLRKVHEGEIWLENRAITRVLEQFSHGGPPGSAEILLSPREREVVGLVAEGCRNREIAQKLFIAEGTVKIHLHNIYEKLGVSDRLELALFAIERQLLPKG